MKTDMMKFQDMIQDAIEGVCSQRIDFQGKTWITGTVYITPENCQQIVVNLNRATEHWKIVPVSVQDTSAQIQSNTGDVNVKIQGDEDIGDTGQVDTNRNEDNLESDGEMTNNFDVHDHEGESNKSGSTTEGCKNHTTSSIKVEPEEVLPDSKVTPDMHHLGTSNIKVQEYDSDHTIIDDNDEDPTYEPEIPPEPYVKLEKINSIHRIDSIKTYRNRCDQCGKCFTQKESLIVHLRIHTGDRPFKCPLCEKTFGDPSTFRKHKKSHDISQQVKCDYCDKYFTVPSMKKYHERVHTQELPFQCTICDKRFNYRASLINHGRVHTGERPYSCRYCELAFKDVSNRCRHERRYHQSEKTDSKKSESKSTPTKLYPCSYCDKMYKYKTSMTDHELSVHQGIKQYQCNICGKSMAARSQYRCHLFRHKGIRNFKCSECDKSFVTARELRLHTNLHTGEIPYKCSICGRGYPTQAGCHHHEKTHTGANQLTCHHCGMTLSGPTALKRHISRVHEGIELERKYKCAHCDKAYLDPATLKIHERTHTGERPFVCHICGKNFRDVKGLRDHEDTHKERTLKCPYEDICVKAYKSQKVLNRHLKNCHSGTKKLKCNKCDQSFTLKATLEGHQKEHHTDIEIDGIPSSDEQRLIIQDYNTAS